MAFAEIQGIRFRCAARMIPVVIYLKIDLHWSQIFSVKEEKSAFQRFVDTQSLSRVQLFATPSAAARQASLSITNSWSLLKLTSIESVMPSSHLILCCPLLLLPSIFPRIRIFFPVNWLFASGGQSIETPHIASFLEPIFGMYVLTYNIDIEKFYIVLNYF